MTALAKERVGSVREVTRERRPLAAGVKVFKGGLAIGITSGTSRGFYRQGVSSAIGLVVGRFTETVDNTAGADGDLSAEIHYLRERHLMLVLNDAGTAVAAADRESRCFVLDDQTVTEAENGAIAGTVYDVTTEGVWIELGGGGGAAPSDVPEIQSGTTTLIAGTKTVTGVKLTANSRIQLTMKDPGAGAITGMGALDAPVASRNTSTGQFVINAIDDSKAVIVTAVSTVDWLIVG